METSIKIEKGIPAPALRSANGLDKTSTHKHLSKMQVDESFLIDRIKRGAISAHISATFHRYTDKRFTISTKDQPADKARVWRVK